MGAEQITPPVDLDVRIFQSRSGSYVHAADLARVLREGPKKWHDKAAPLYALGLNAAADYVERIAVFREAEK